MSAAASRRFLPRDPFAILFLLFCFSFLFFTRTYKSSITLYSVGDDDFYWSTPRNLVFDGDLDFTDEPLPTFRDLGLSTNYITPFPGLLWLPAVALTRALNPVIRRLPAADPAACDHGTSPYHRLLISAWSSTLTLLGLFFLYALLRRYFSNATALLTAIVCLWSTPLMYYTWRRPLMAHSGEFLTLAATACWSAEYFSRPRKWMGFLLGLTAALAVGVRYPNLFVSAAIVLGFYLHERPLWRESWASHLYVAAGAAVPLAVQLAIYLHLHGVNPVTQGPYAAGSGLYSELLRMSNDTFHRIVHIFTGRDWGLLWMETPLLLVLPFTVLNPRPFGLLRACLLLALLPLLLIAANFGFPGGSYAYRYLLAKVIWEAFGFALILQALRNDRRRILLTAACCVLPLYFYILFESGPEILTLVSTPAGWDNPAYVVNCLKTALHTPQQIAFAISGAPVFHALTELFVKILGPDAIPSAIRDKLAWRVRDISLILLGWFVFWQVVFSVLAWRIFKRYSNA